MHYRPIRLLSTTAALLLGCGSAASTPAPSPATPSSPTEAPRAHQSQEKPKLPQRQASPGKSGSDTKKSKLTFDLPPGWTPIPDASIPQPWKLGFYNRSLQAQVLADFSVRGPMPAAALAADIAQGICPQRKWVCSKPKPLASGDGAYFTVTYNDARGKIAVRDLDGSGRCQLQLFGLWHKDNDEAATASFDTMLNSAAVE